MKSIEEVKDLENKIVLVRLDLNVPIKESRIIDANRINKIIPTLKFLRSKNSNLILVSHIGRPKEANIPDFSLEPLVENISKQLNENVRLIYKNINELEKQKIFKSDAEKIVMLENIRFYPEEKKNDPHFAKHLASFCDLYVNEAFSCSHRKHASVCEITNYCESYAGLLLCEELNALNKITSKIIKPITCIIGGSKISSKLNIIENLIPKFDNIVIIGGMANNFLKFKGINIGKSIYEKNSDHIVKKIISLAEKKNCRLIFPKDFSVGKKMDDLAKSKKINEIENDDIILDIGLETIEFIKSIINDSKTILWNGPAGYFENHNFAKGSYEIAKKIANNTLQKKVYSVAGGGDTVTVINKLNLFKSFNFVSTAGGAFLEFLEGKELPGIKALK